MLVFQDFIQSWVGFELVKVLNVFGLQPKIRDDLEAWSPDLFATFTYLCNREASNDQHKKKAFKMLDLIFDKTEHNSYFGKLNFGSKEKFKTANNSALYLLILTWLRQLEQYFYKDDGNDDSDVDWNKHGRYYATSTYLRSSPLANINMAKADGIKTPVTDVSFFEPLHRDGVCVSLEEWGARIFKPRDIKIQRDAKSGCEITKQRFDRANRVTDDIKFTSTDLSISKVSNDNNDEDEDAAMAYDISPDTHKHQSKEMLLYNLSRGIQLLLSKSEKNCQKKKKIKEGEEDDNRIAITAASSLMALANRLDESYNFKDLDIMQNHMSNHVTAQISMKTDEPVARKNINSKKGSEQNKSSSDSDSSSSSEYKKKTPQKKRKFHEVLNLSSDSESDSESD